VSSGTATVTLPTDEQILITREFDAPKHLVWRAWTTPELVKRWWHANRGAMVVCEIDLRVGGMWRYVMVADGGLEVGFHGEYREIVPSERLVSTEVYEGIPDAEEHAAIDILTLTEIGEILFVSRNTVKTHVVSIYRKLGATDRSEAVGRARELGLLTTEA